MNLIHRKNGSTTFVEGLESRRLLCAAVAPIALHHEHEDVPRFAGLKGPAGPPGEPAVVDLLIAYTTQAKEGAGSAAALRTQLEAAVADANQVFANSLINVTLRLVHAAEVGYQESGSLNTDLSRLALKEDGYLDGVHALRDEHGADVVTLYTETGDSGGMAYLLENPGSAEAGDFAMAVVRREFGAAPQYHLAHEVGHTLGANHDHDNVIGNSPWDHAYGHSFTAGNGKRYRDVMSYPPGITIPYFSNPNVQYAGSPVGVTGGDRPADIASVFEETKWIVSAYRPTKVADTVAPSASVESVNVAGNRKSMDVEVRFVDDSAVDIATVGQGDVLVTGPDNAEYLARFVSVDQPTSGGIRVATYRIAGESDFDLPDGLYELAIPASQVKDVFGNTLEAGTRLKVDTAKPAGEATANDVTTEAAPTHRFTVTYTDNEGIDVSTLDAADLIVTGPGGFSQPATFISVSPPSPQGTRVATYEVNSRYTAWDGTENGRYTITARAGQVRDVHGNAVPAGAIGWFDVKIAGNSLAGALDLGVLGGPRAIQERLTDGVDTADFYTITLTERGRVSVSIGDLRADANLLLVNNRNGNGTIDDGETIAFPNQPGTADESLSAVLDPGTYQVWVYRVNGDTTYTLSLDAAKVAGPDTAPPTAAAVTPSITQAGGTMTTITVTYADASGVDAATIGRDELKVVGPNGYSAVGVFREKSTADDGKTYSAVYEVPAAGGTWDESDNGAYSIAVGSSRVQDVLGNAVPGSQIGAFQVDISPTGGPAVRPAAVASAPTFQKAGKGSLAFFVTYSGASPIDVQTLDATKLRVVTAKGQVRTARFYSWSASSDPTVRRAKFILTAPAKGWSPADNGTYRVKLQADHIKDVDGTGSAAAATAGTFVVAVPDTTPPTATLAAPTVTRAGGKAYTFKVRYADNVGVQATSLGKGDVVVTSGAFRASAVLVSKITGKAGAIVATYRIIPPGGKWDAPDNGTFAVGVAAKQVKDLAGNLMPARKLGAFSVKVGE